MLVGIGGLQLGKHEFADALATGKKAVALSPNLASARAVVVDALVELGRYDEAATAADEMLGVGSDLATLSRVSYLAELHGNLDVALAAMKLAVKSPGLAPENTAFAESLLGNLLSTRATGPARPPPTTEPSRSSRPTPRRWRARAASRSATGDSTRRSRSSNAPPTSCRCPNTSSPWPTPRRAAGKSDEAAKSIKLARAEIALFKATGVVVDLDLALFEADHGDPAAALGFAETASKATPTDQSRRRPRLGAASSRSRRRRP